MVKIVLESARILCNSRVSWILFAMFSFTIVIQPLDIVEWTFTNQCNIMINVQFALRVGKRTLETFCHQPQCVI